MVTSILAVIGLVLGFVLQLIYRNWKEKTELEEKKKEQERLSQDIHKKVSEKAKRATKSRRLQKRARK